MSDDLENLTDRQATASNPTALIHEADALLGGITPGEWWVDTGSFDQVASVHIPVTGDGTHLFTCPECRTGAETERDHASFVAAAPDLVKRLRDALAASEAALAEAHEQIDTMIEKGVEEGMFLKSFTAEDGSAKLSMETRGAAEAVMLAMLDGMANTLDENKAENYVEFDLIRRGKRPVSACVRWLHHPTPHELRVRAESERDEARTALEEERSYSAHLQEELRRAKEWSHATVAAQNDALTLQINQALSREQERESERDAARSALTEAREEIENYDRTLIRSSEIMTGVANALNGPPPDLTTWSHHDLTEKAQAAVDALAASDAAIERVLALADLAESDSAGGSLEAIGQNIAAGIRRAVADSGDRLRTGAR